jgi:hypothetical protein
MKRIVVVLTGIVGLAMAGCDSSTPTPAAQEAIAEKPAEPTPPAKPAPQAIDLATAVVTSKSAMLVEDTTAGGKLLTTDPAYGGYSVLIPLPVVPGSMTVRLELEVKKGAIGLVLTEALDANNWATEERVANAGEPLIVELNAKVLDPAKSLLLRNANESGPSEAIVKSLTLIAP